MTLDLRLILAIPAFIVAIAAMVVMSRKLMLWWCPIKLSVMTGWDYRVPESDWIGVRITNISNDIQLITKCNVYAVYPIINVLRQCIKRPALLLRPDHIQWRVPMILDFTKDAPIRLEPKEQRDLKSGMLLRVHEMNRMLFVTGEIMAEVHVAGRHRIFRSQREIVRPRPVSS